MTTMTVPSFDIRRLAITLIQALVMTFLIFAVMSALISKPPQVTVDAVEVKPFDFILEELQPKDNQIDRALPEPPQAKTVPPSTALPESNDDPDTGLGTPFDDFTIGNPAAPEIAGPSLGMTDRQASPIVRVAPRYPADAARNGIEGWVKLTFSIDPTGRVNNVEVIDANPKRVFNKEAIRALKKWKYRPQMDNGKAISQHNQSVVLDFKLES